MFKNTKFFYLIISLLCLIIAGIFYYRLHHPPVRIELNWDNPDQTNKLKPLPKSNFDYDNPSK